MVKALRGSKQYQARLRGQWYWSRQQTDQSTQGVVESNGWYSTERGKLLIYLTDFQNLTTLLMDPNSVVIILLPESNVLSS